MFVHYSDDSFYELYSIDIDGTNLTLIDRAEKYCGSPGWSPDGQKIACTASGDNQSTRIFVADNDGSNSVQLSSHYLMNYFDTDPVSFGNYYP